MTIGMVENEIRRSLSTTEPEVICISGRWGVGKTFAWRHYFEEARTKKGGIALLRYSYVSLFGLNSLEDFKYSIFLNTVDVISADGEQDAENKRNSLLVKAKGWGKKVLSLQRVSAVKDKLGDISALWFPSVNRTLVCIDDIERHGDDLSIKDVLGLVSYLKEQKQCKIILILNDEQLDELKPFRLYFEKVIDAHMKFAPSAEESVRIALTTATETARLLGMHCVALGISNIRVIKKIERLIRIVEPVLAKYDEKLLRQAVQSLVLLGWCVYEPGVAPPVDYVEKFNAYLLEFYKDKEVGENEATWNRLLTSYNFTNLDEFDAELLNGIRDGYFNKEKLEEQAAKLDKAIKDGESDESFKEAWELYHGSFANNQDEVLDAIAASFKKNVHVISAVNLNGTVSLLKELGRAEQAKELIDFYIVSRAESPDLFDLANTPFGSEVRDPDVRAAFEKQRDAVRDQREPRDILLAIADKQGWSQDDVKILAAVSVDEYYRLFTENKRDEMQRMIWTALSFEKVGDSTSQEIAKRAREALERIGRESTINARRVRRYGIRVDE